MRVPAAWSLNRINGTDKGIILLVPDIRLNLSREPFRVDLLGRWLGQHKQVGLDRCSHRWRQGGFRHQGRISATGISPTSTPSIIPKDSDPANGLDYKDNRSVPHEKPFYRRSPT